MENQVKNQNIYIFFSGMGSQEYFTAPNDELAKEFIEKEKGKQTYYSAFRTQLEIVASGTYMIPEHRLFSISPNNQIM
jgi:hypothetical protein